MLVSLIFTACNQSDWVRTTLPLARESIGDTPHEIIVVDDQSVDGCCHELGKDCLVVRTEQRLGVSGSRRLGADRASGDVLIFSDPHCEYPDNALRSLANLAYVNRAIVQPPTKNRPQSSRIAYGGRLENSDRGIVVHTSQPQAQPWPAMINTIYALQRDVYESIGGWPHLPGCWGYSEQAMTLLAWACGVPIVVADTTPCVHYHYQINRRLPFYTSTTERAANAHYVHAAFFPELYEKYFRQLLIDRFRVDGREFLRERLYRNLKEQLANFAIHRDEGVLLRHIDGLDASATDIEVDQGLLEQQRQRALEMGCSRERPRLAKTIDWFRKTIPGCIRGRTVLDVGAHDGLGCDYLKRFGARRIQGIELVPDMVKLAQQKGRPVIQGNLQNLPNRPVWDLVTCIHTLEHLPNPADGIQSIAKSLRPGGWALIVVPKEYELHPERAHNYLFPDRNALKKLVIENGQFEAETIRTQVLRYAPGEREIRLAVQKKRTPPRRIH